MERCVAEGLVTELQMDWLYHAFAHGSQDIRTSGPTSGVLPRARAARPQRRERQHGSVGTLATGPIAVILSIRPDAGRLSINQIAGRHGHRHARAGRRSVRFALVVRRTATGWPSLQSRSRSCYVKLESPPVSATPSSSRCTVTASLTPGCALRRPELHHQPIRPLDHSDRTFRDTGRRGHPSYARRCPGASPKPTGGSVASSDSQVYCRALSGSSESSMHPEWSAPNSLASDLSLAMSRSIIVFAHERQ